MANEVANRLRARSAIPIHKRALYGASERIGMLPFTHPLSSMVAAQAVLGPMMGESLESSIYSGVGFAAADIGLRGVGKMVNYKNFGGAFNISKGVAAAGKGLFTAGGVASRMATGRTFAGSGLIGKAAGLGLRAGGIGLGVGALALRSLGGVATAAMVLGAFAPPGSAAAEASSYLSGEKIGSYMMEQAQMTTRNTSGFGRTFNRDILENQRVIRSRQHAMSLIGQSGNHSLLGREAEMMHN